MYTKQEEFLYDARVRNALRYIIEYESPYMYELFLSFP